MAANQFMENHVQRGRKSDPNVSEKQLEVYEQILGCVRESGYQPNCVELCKLLQVARPAIRDRIAYLIKKGLLKAPPFGAERRYGFVGVKFLPYQVDPVTEQIVEEQEYEIGEYVVSIKRKKAARPS